MSTYQAPLKDMGFVIDALVDIETICAEPGFADTTPELVSSVLDEAAKFAAGAVAPLGTVGETDPPKIVDGQVQQSAGFAELHQQFVAGGWNAVSADPNFGGMGLPQVVGFATMEMWSAANLSFALCPMLSQGAIEAIESHASDALKASCLRQLINGTWTGTMNLTEPQAGSDLAAIKTRAVAEGDHYRISGSKIFITWGDHAMSDNIVHLVLARIDGAPPGLGGVSMFLVPKYLFNSDGSLTARNRVNPISLEEKMGIHGSPTCSMNYGDAEAGALGYLVGEEGKGLSYMFTMMNHARLNVGIQAVALSDRACQLAVGYAAERVQGTPAGRSQGTIIHHPDVRRMLMLMRSLSEASRAVCYVTAGCMDVAHGATDMERSAAAHARCNLLIPIAKAWSTEIAQEVTSLGVQVHGGAGYIEETGAAQLLRDARITTIYEGTTGIQANDFAGRKVIRDQGKELRKLIEEMRVTQERLAQVPTLALAASAMQQSIECIESGLRSLLAAGDDPVATAAAAVNFLMGCGTCIGGWLLGRSALAASELHDDDPDFYGAKVTTFRFYAVHVLPRTHAYMHAAVTGSAVDLTLSDSQFGV
jgi:acyl-CoA dehydrogenase